MANNISNVSFTSPAYDYAGELSDIERRKALAQALQAQGMAPGGGTKMVGNIAIKNSPLEGLAKALQSGVGEYANYDAKRRQAELTKKAQTDLSTTLTDAMRAYTGTPGSPEIPMPSDEAGGGPGRAAVAPVAGDPMAAAMRMMQNPQTASMAGPMMQDALKAQKLAAALRAASGQADPTQAAASGAPISPAASQPSGVFGTPAMRFMAGMGDTAGIGKLLADNPYAKIDPSKFTPDSLAAFRQSGDQSVLRPIEQGIMADMGNGSQLIGRNTGAPIGQMIPRAVSPNTQATLGFNMFQHQNPSAYQAGQLALGQQNANAATTNATNRGVETQFNTGGGVLPPSAPAASGGPGPAALGGWMPPGTVRGPNGYPVAPPAQQAGRDATAASMKQNELAAVERDIAAGNLSPQDLRNATMARDALRREIGGTPGQVPLTGKSLQAAALKSIEQKTEMENKREFNMAGIGGVIDEARNILSGKGGKSPTASGIGTAMDWAGSIIGRSPDGAPEADKLRAIAGTLTSKVPRMEGPQSDRDVQLYRESAGQVGDSTLPIARRLAALETVDKLFRKYDKSAQGATASTGQIRRAGDVRIVDW